MYSTQAVRQLTASLEEAERRTTAVLNKYDPTHADFDPDFTKGRPYSAVADVGGGHLQEDRVSDPFLYQQTKQRQQDAERRRSAEMARSAREHGSVAEDRRVNEKKQAQRQAASDARRPANRKKHREARRRATLAGGH